MPRPRFSKLAPARRQVILETAAAEFASHGFERASLNHIIDSTGLSKGVFYYYFDSKADLFGAVVDLAWETLSPDRTFDVESLDRSTFWPSLEALSLATRQRIRERPWLAGVGRLLYDPLPAAGLDSLIRSKAEQGRAWLSRVIDRGQRVGAVRTDLPAELLLTLLTTADRAADHWMADRLEGMPVRTHDRLIRDVLDLWRRIGERRD